LIQLPKFLNLKTRKVAQRVQHKNVMYRRRHMPTFVEIYVLKVSFVDVSFMSECLLIFIQNEIFIV
jgi:hypothetical protein